MNRVQWTEKRQNGFSSDKHFAKKKTIAITIHLRVYTLCFSVPTTETRLNYAVTA